MRGPKVSSGVFSALWAARGEGATYGTIRFVLRHAKRRPSGGMAARDVVDEVLDLDLVVLAYPACEVADGDDTGYLAVLHHGEVAAAALGHDRHRLFDRRRRLNHDEVGRHHF